PTMGFSPSWMGKVIVETGHHQLEFDVHVTVFRVNADKGQRTLKIAFVFIDGDVPLWNGNRETGSRHYIFRVFCDKGRTVVPGTIGYLDDFFGLKSAQADTCDSGRIVPIDKNPASIQFTIGL